MPTVRPVERAKGPHPAILLRNTHLYCRQYREAAWLNALARDPGNAKAFCPHLQTRSCYGTDNVLATAERGVPRLRLGLSSRTNSRVYGEKRTFVESALASNECAPYRKSGHLSTPSARNQVIPLKHSPDNRLLCDDSRLLSSRQHFLRSRGQS